MICPRVLGWSGRDKGSAPSLIISIPPEITTRFSCTSKIEIVHNYCIFYFQISLSRINCNLFHGRMASEGRWSLTGEVAAKIITGGRSHFISFCRCNFMETRARLELFVSFNHMILILWLTLLQEELGKLLSKWGLQRKQLRQVPTRIPKHGQRFHCSSSLRATLCFSYKSIITNHA